MLHVPCHKFCTRVKLNWWAQRCYICCLFICSSSMCNRSAILNTLHLHCICNILLRCKSLRQLYNGSVLNLCSVLYYPLIDAEGRQLDFSCKLTPQRYRQKTTCELANRVLTCLPSRPCWRLPCLQSQLRSPGPRCSHQTAPLDLAWGPSCHSKQA